MNKFTTIPGTFEYQSELLIFTLPMMGNQTARFNDLELNEETGHHEYYCWDEDGTDYLVVCVIDTDLMKEEKRYQDTWNGEATKSPASAYIAACNYFMSHFQN